MMKLGEKLQQLRKKSGLSQEQLAAQITVSRQAVSKWELDMTMPDTDNVIQLSRLFGVSCDYLLREEVDEQGAPLNAQDAPTPTAPEETPLTQQGWIHSATILSLTICATGLLLAIVGGLYSTSAGPAVIGLIIQLGGILTFELAVLHTGGRKTIARLRFYAIACWLVLFIPVPLLVHGFFALSGWSYRPRHLFFFCVLFYILFNASVTVALLVLRRRTAAKT